MSVICRLFCEDYGGRSSGGPDLFVWNAEKRKCKFVEVKGPGDTPQENQKLWFDSLLRAEADVEICKVIDITDTEASTRKRKAQTPGSARRKSGGREDIESEEEDYDQLDRDAEESETADTAGVSNLPSPKRRRISGPEELP